MAMMLVLEAVLCDRDWPAVTLYKLYEDMPSRHSTLEIQWARYFKTNKLETEIKEPQRLQDMIFVLCKMRQGSRAFVRPSGSHASILRVYTEAKTEKDVEEIIIDIMEEISTRWFNFGIDQ